jgi:outer membrane receptor for ferrienterochelin and colicin
VKAYDDGSEDYRLHDELYNDLQARYTFMGSHEIYVCVDNLFNNKPIHTGGLIVVGMESDTGTYDPLGRRYYAVLKLSF